LLLVLIETLISSKTRIKLLLKFFLNSNTRSYLRSLEDEFNESSNGIRLELNRFEQAGMLVSSNVGNKKWFKANTQHPLFTEVKSIVLKYVGIDQLLNTLLTQLGNVQEVYLTGSFASGLDSQTIEIIIIGDINQAYLSNLVQKTETHIRRKVQYRVYTYEQSLALLDLANKQDYLLLYSK
jgi:hypothetical protein